MDTVINVKNFSKSFGKKQVINDLSFKVFKGDIFAFLGANGSGKTTTLRALLGIYTADKGTLLINGEKFNIEDSHKIGYLPEERGLYLNMKVLETLIYFAELKGLKKQEAKSRAEQYLKRVGLFHKADSNIKKLSSGQQQKIQLGVTVIHEPELLILDEPTKGLDPLNRRLLLDLLFELNNNGSTIIFSTHLMEEAEKVANRMLMLNKGNIGVYGDVAEIRGDFAENSYTVETKEKLPKETDIFTTQPDGKTVDLKPKVKKIELLKYITENNISLERFEKKLPTLEEIFIKVSNE